MIKFKAELTSPNIELNIMGRKRTFKNGEEVGENAYTKAYPQHFVRIGEEFGYSVHLTKPVFIADPIEEFLKKEEERKEGSQKYISDTLEDEFIVQKDELADAIAEHIESNYSIDVDEEEIEDIIDDFDVKIETEDL
jgi:hypothetical protein